MKVYTKVVIDIESGDILEEHSYEYDGPIAECKGGSAPKHTTTTQKTEPWSGAQWYLKNIYSRAYDLSKKPIPYYPGKQLADFTPAEKEYFNLATQYGLYGTPDYQKGVTTLDLTTPFTLRTYEDVASMARPIASGETMDITKNAALKNMLDYALDRTLGNINAQASRFGAYGGSSYQDWVRDATSKLLANVYESEANRQLTAQGLLGQWANEVADNMVRQALGRLALESSRLNQLGLMKGAGEEQRAYEQALLDIAKEKFYHPYLEPWKRLGDYASLVTSGSIGGTTITERPYFAPSTASNLISGLMTGAGLAGSLGLLGKGAGGLGGVMSPWAIPFILGGALAGTL